MHPPQTAHDARARDLIARLDVAVTAPDSASICARVKGVLEQALGQGTELLDPAFLVPAPKQYARRLLHRDPQERYTVVVMVWDQGQGTPLHDHAGMWCVECVYRGRIEVGSFDLVGDPHSEVVQFQRQSAVFSGIGEAGALIPPFEYHWIRNPDPTAAVTVHVYGGEMVQANCFFPLPSGGYRRESRPLSYTAD